MSKPNLSEIALRVLYPLNSWAAQCHAASVELVRSGELGTCRVARGACMGVNGQHSWVVLGNDCYDDEATIVDPTLWSYDSSVEGIWIGSYQDRRHMPHGKGLIWAWGRPEQAIDESFELTPRQPWSAEARMFLEMLGPLDRSGWAMLAHAPVEGWPAGEIIDAMCESGLAAIVPIDIVGMVTDRNPGGVYLPVKGEDDAQSK